jgi:hypothetical protein
VFIGDSFSDQIRFALFQSNVVSKIIFSSYFQTREVYGSGGNQIETSVTSPRDAQDKLMADISEADIIILEMVDYNVSKLSYGFSNFFLKK